jgi:hypothetical protein
MTIAEARGKCKTLIASVPRDMLIISVLILVSSASFGFGYLAGIDAGQGSGSGLTLDSSPESSAIVSTSTTTSASGQFVASKNGTKYYLPSCVGANQISNANKIWFASASAAKTAGYTPAANCKGI